MIPQSFDPIRRKVDQVTYTVNLALVLKCVNYRKRESTSQSDSSRSNTELYRLISFYRENAVSATMRREAAAVSWVKNVWPPSCVGNRIVVSGGCVSDMVEKFCASDFGGDEASWLQGLVVGRLCGGEDCCQRTMVFVTCGGGDV